ncbi:MAG: class I tRNA ligase family protein, partial [Rhodoglobus sp.]
IVLGSDGQKMSKSLRNYPDVSEVFDRDGADAMRWFLMSSSVIRGGNLVVTEEGIREGVRQVLLPLWSTYYFFTLYANSADNYTANWRTDSTNLLDRYLLAKTHQLLAEMTGHLERLDSPLAALALRDFADVLTNWYVRRSRDRFWSGSDTDAFDTLYTVLETVTRAAAPLLPLVSEEIWRGLTGGRSVHLEDWPDAALFPADDALVAAMDRVREVASSVLALRKAQGLRVRLPLARLTVVSDDGDAIAGFADILRDELNVKDVVTNALADHTLAEYGISQRLGVNARALGPRVGKDVQRIIQAAKAGDWSQTGTSVTAGGTELLEGEYELTLESADPTSAIAFLGGGGFVILDTETTPQLEAEGLARDVIRAIQDARKSAGFDVSDRIALRVGGSSPTDIDALNAFGETIAAETLATAASFELSDDPATDAALKVAVGGYRATLAASDYANAGVLVIDVRRAYLTASGTVESGAVDV